jgi:hypothetical protein
MERKTAKHTALNNHTMEALSESERNRVERFFDRM